MRARWDEIQPHGDVVMASLSRLAAMASILRLPELAHDRCGLLGNIIGVRSPICVSRRNSHQRQAESMAAADWMTTLHTMPYASR